MINYNPDEKTFEINLKLTNEQASALYKAVRKRYKDLYNPNTHTWEKYEELAEGLIPLFHLLTINIIKII